MQTSCSRDAEIWRIEKQYSKMKYERPSPPVKTTVAFIGTITLEASSVTVKKTCGNLVHNEYIASELSSRRVAELAEKGSVIEAPCRAQAEVASITHPIHVSNSFESTAETRGLFHMNSLVWFD